MAEPHFAVQHLGVEHMKKQASGFADAYTAKQTVLCAVVAAFQPYQSYSF